MNKKYLGLGLISLLVLGIVVWAFTIREPATTFKEFKIIRGEISASILATGTVQPENRLQIKPPISGRLDDLLVDEGQKVKKGQILAWMSSTERAALIDSARSKGPEEVKRWEELYKPTPLIAPLSGMIIAKSILSGQTFTTTDAILVMSDRLTVKAQVDETDLAQIQLKQAGEIRLDAYPDQPIEAAVDQIAFEAKTVSNVTTYVVDVLPVKTPDFMRSGMTANVTFVLKSKKDVLVISNEFIKYNDGKPVALLKTEDGPAERELQLGATDGRQTEVLSGLNENDTVLLQQAKKNKKSSNPFGPPSPPGGKKAGKGK